MRVLQFVELGSGWGYFYLARGFMDRFQSNFDWRLILVVHAVVTPRIYLSNRDTRSALRWERADRRSLLSLSRRLPNTPIPRQLQLSDLLLHV
jgi:hypothetical protein